MSLFGPFTAVANVLQSCPVDPSAGAIYVRNTSRYDLAISLQNAQPVAATASSFGGPPWDVIVPAGDRVGIDLAQGRFPGGFSGIVWVLPVDNSGNLALSGSVSISPTFYIEGYLSPAALPADYASPLFVNTASQPRNISIPIGLTHWAQGNISLSGTTDLQSFVLTAAQVAALTCTIYFYYLAVCPETGTTGSLDFTIQIQFFHSGVGVGTPFTFIAGSIAANNANTTMTPFFLTPAFPLVFQLNGSVPATSDSVRVQITKPAGTTLRVNYTVACNLDLTNLVPVADIGTAALYNSSQARF